MLFTSMLGRSVRIVDDLPIGYDNNNAFTNMATAFVQAHRGKIGEIVNVYEGYPAYPSQPWITYTILFPNGEIASVYLNELIRVTNIDT